LKLCVWTAKIDRIMRNQYRSSALVWALIAVNVAVFIVTTARPDIGNYLAMTKPIFDSHYWSILTAMFVHAGFSHIFFNMLNLYFFGTLCLQLADRKRFLLVYFLGGIVGNLLFLLIGPMYSAAVGASGAIFALGGVLAMMRPTLRVYLYFFIPMPLWLGIIIGFALTAFVAGIAWQAHLGGLIVGLIVGFILRRREKQRYWQHGYYRR
jgi:membrane associated rhomboid family serine protease